jgi:hypothetical protein
VTTKVYESIGGARAMNQHAEQVFSELGTEAQRIAEGMFRRLTEGEVRTPTRMKDIAEVTGATLEALSSVVDAFRRGDRAFLTPPETVPLTPDTVLDITSALLISDWARLRDWITRETQSAQIYKNLRVKAEHWRQGRPDTWTTQETKTTLAWRDETKPTSAWAERYGGNFEAAMALLDAIQIRPRSDPRQRRDTFEYEFYVSFAHVDLDDSLESFIDSLRRAVRRRTGQDPGRVAFMDTAAIRSGERWSEALTSGLARSAVLVSILSRAYFASEYCGREVQFFSQLRGGLAGRVIPVLWRPVADIPRPFADLQLFTPDLPEGPSTGSVRRRGQDIDVLAETIIKLAGDARSRADAPAAMPDFERVQSAWPVNPGRVEE